MFLPATNTLIHNVSASLTQPENAVAYTPGTTVTDMLGHSLVFATGFNPGKKYVIEQATCTIKSNQEVKPDLELWLFSSDVTLPADGRYFGPTETELKSLVEIIRLPAADFRVIAANLNGAEHSPSCPEHVECTARAGFIVRDTPTLYGILVVKNAYVPVSAETFQFDLRVVVKA